MGIASGETVEAAYERAFEAARAEADLHWSKVPLDQVLGLDWEDEFDESEFEERARAATESASAYELMLRLQGAASSESRRSRSITDALELLRAVDRLTSWVAARQASLIAEVFDHIRGREVIERGNARENRSQQALDFTLAAQEIAPLLRVPGRTAQRMLSDALHLTEDLPATWKALDVGRISSVQAQVIVEESGSIPIEAVPGFEETVLEAAGGLTRPKLVRRCRRLREELHPESITVRRVRAVAERRVVVEPELDGMAWLGAYLPAEQAQGIFNRVDAAARSLQGPEEPRTLSQLRADVFADVLTHTCAGDPKRGTGFRGVGASVFVTVPVMTLLGHRRDDWQNPARTGAEAADGVPDLAGCENGLLDGYGPIDRETGMRLAAHAPSFTRILVHPETGAVLSVGRDRYRPPKHLQDWVRITNPTCVHPGCNRSSWSCEIDHVVPWAHGGKTELGNLKPRCKLHHMLKTEGIWPATHNAHGTPHLTSLGGQTYTTVPEPPPPF